MVEQASIDTDTRQKHKERSRIKNLLHQNQKRREEEDEARALIETMQRTLDQAQTRSHEVNENSTEYSGKFQTPFKKKWDARTTS